MKNAWTKALEEKDKENERLVKENLRLKQELARAVMLLAEKN